MSDEPQIKCELTAPGYRSGVELPVGVDAAEAFCSWFAMQLDYLKRRKPGMTTCLYETTPIPSGLLRLLNEVDGHLGLAVYRSEHDERWKSEARDLIIRLRTAAKEIEAGAADTTERGREG